MITLLQLEYALALERTRNFKQAAEEMFIAQPTLSLQIQKLERYLGFNLFDRSTSPVTVLKNAESFFKQARIVVSESKKLEYLFTGKEQELNVEVRIGIIPTIAGYLLKDLLPALYRKYPGLKIKLYEIPTRNILKDLTSGRLDIGILATPLHIKNIREYPVYYEPFYIYLPPHQDKAPSTLDLEKLQDFPVLVLGEDHCFGQQQLRICHTSSQGSIEAGSFHTLISLVESGLGLTLLPEFVEPPFPERKRKIKGSVPAREISLVTNQDFYLTPVLNAIKNEIKSIIPRAYHQKKDWSVLGVQVSITPES